MKNAIILHGMPGKEECCDASVPSASNSHWLPWLQKQLLTNDIYAVTPEMPVPWMPDYEVWKKEFERFDITPETILVGHSCGAGLIVKYLSENDAKVGRVVLVAPWLDPEREIENGFYENLVIDPELVKKADGITIFSSTDDSAQVHASEQRIMKEVEDVKYVEFKNYSHFVLGAMGTDEFPELLDECLT